MRLLVVACLLGCIAAAATALSVADVVHEEFKSFMVIIHRRTITHKHTHTRYYVRTERVTSARVLMRIMPNGAALFWSGLVPGGSTHAFTDKSGRPSALCTPASI